MARISDSQKVLEWQRRMARFQGLQLTVSRFCRDEQISVASFYLWRKKLACLPPVTTAAVAPTAVNDAGRSFMPVRVMAASVVAVHLPGGTQLQIPTADAQALQLVIHVLARLDAERAGGERC